VAAEVIKATVTRVLPQSAVDSINDVRTRVRLSPVAARIELRRSPRVVCDTSNLRRDLDLAAVLSPDLDTWLYASRQIERAGLAHNPGGINPGDRRAVSSLAARLGPGAVLEIGTHVGSSTLALAASLPASSRITTVDIIDVNDPISRPWERFGSQYSPKELTDRESVRVEYVTSNSLDFLAQTTETYDFIFLDGDHGPRTLYQELPLACAHLNRDGLILIHDYFPDMKPLWPDGRRIPGPWLATQRLIREGASLRIVPLGQLPWPTKQGTNVTSLAVALAR
jgi:predicted O-methyltransferase YrrM